MKAKVGKVYERYASMVWFVRYQGTTDELVDLLWPDEQETGANGFVFLGFRRHLPQPRCLSVCWSSTRCWAGGGLQGRQGPGLVGGGVAVSDMILKVHHTWSGAMSIGPIPADIRDDAERLLRRRGDAKAVVLFGSRARGQARERSDWDVALITRSGFGRFLEADEHGFSRSGVECIVLPESEIEADCRTVGRLARCVLRDGVVLAGRWDHMLPTTGIQLDVDDYISALSGALARIGEAGRHYGELGDELSNWDSDDYASNAFVQRTADAAERFGKALLIGLGLDPVERHSMAALAEQARRAGFLEQARWLDDLNGGTRDAHMADHFGRAKATLDQCRSAVQRFQGALRLYERVMTHWPNEVPEERKHQAMLRGAESLRQVAWQLSQARLGDYCDPDAPPPKVAALLEGRDALIATVEQVCTVIGFAAR